jgi:fructose-bisphosphate aldolase class 1
MNQGIVYMINPEVVISKQISYCRLYEYLGIELVDSFRINHFDNNVFRNLDIQTV